MTRMLAAVGIGLLLVASTTAPPAQVSSGRHLHAAPDGLASNDGSCTAPLDLATALSRRSPLRPGDTLWLHGGVYRGAFTSAPQGTERSPITIRQYPGDRVTIDNAGSSRDALTIAGGWTIWQDIEITNSSPERLSRLTGSWPDDLQRGFGVVTRAPGVMLINLVIHDLANGIGLWEESRGSEAYGNIVYYNGWQGPDRAHGHGIYTQNRNGPRRLTDNIVFDQFSHGIHAYGSAKVSVDDIVLEGNIVFNNGALAQEGFARDILVGGGRTARAPRLVENATYGGAHSIVGYGSGCEDGRLTDNYFAGHPPLRLWRCTPVMTGNTLHGDAGELPAQFPENRYLGSPPSGTIVRLRPNRFEPGRAHVVVYNWDHLPEVELDLARSGLVDGMPFEIRDVQDPLGAPVVTGIYSRGQTVRLPMRPRPPALPAGPVPRAPVSTAPEFGVFVVMPVRPAWRSQDVCGNTAAASARP